MCLGYVADSLNSDSECINSEHMCSEIIETNAIIDSSPDPDLNTMVLSLDVKALYPSLEPDKCQETIIESVLESRITFSNVNYSEIGKMLRILCTDSEIVKYRLGHLIPIRSLDLVGSRLKVKLSYLDSDSATKGLDKWTWRQNWDPTPAQQRRLMAVYLGKLSKWIMTNHIYQFDGQMYLQLLGAPIGLQISVNIARLVMISWDKSMRRKLVENNIRCEMLLRYVDDVNLILRVLRTRNINQDQECDQMTAGKIVEIADSVRPGMLEFEADYASKNESGKLPILDLECWMEDDLVKTTFYKKSVATDSLITPKSGFTNRVTRNILVQEGVRRLVNCSPDLPASQRLHHLSLFSLLMKKSGHCQSFRQNIITRALQLYNIRRQGTLYRSREQIQEARKSRSTKSSWFKKSGADAVINIPPSVNEELASQVKRKVDQLNLPDGCQVKVQQGYGRTVLSRVMTYNTKQSDGCQRPNCMTCRNGINDASCYSENINYQIRCDRTPCNLDVKEEVDNIKIGESRTDNPPVVYRGETSRTMFTRGQVHLKSYRSNNKDTQNKSVLWRHTRDRHQGILGDEGGVHDYKMSLLGKDNNPLSRQCREGLYIADLEDKEEQGTVKCLNSKQDFLQSQRVTLDFRRGERNIT